MPSIDLRGFQDPLAPLRKRREWQLDQALATAGALRVRVSEAEARRRHAIEQLQNQSALAAQAWAKRRDPCAHARLLPYLVQRHASVLACEDEERRLREELADAQKAALRRQQEVDVLERHRSEQMADYRLMQERKLAVQADREWNARSPVRAGASR